jgi:hypothetical protein
MTPFGLLKGGAHKATQTDMEGGMRDLVPEILVAIGLAIIAAVIAAYAAELMLAL